MKFAFETHRRVIKTFNVLRWKCEVPENCYSSLRDKVPEILGVCVQSDEGLLNIRTRPDRPFVTSNCIQTLAFDSFGHKSRTLMYSRKTIHRRCQGFRVPKTLSNKRVAGVKDIIFLIDHNLPHQRRESNAAIYTENHIQHIIRQLLIRDKFFVINISKVCVL